MDFDAVLPRRQQQLTATAKRYNAPFFLIRNDIPETLILQRLRAKHYTKKELFNNAKEAIRVCHIRKKLHVKRLQTRPNFVINNSKPLTSQIQQIVKKVNFHGLTPVALAEYELRSPACSGTTSSHALTRGVLRRKQ